MLAWVAFLALTGAGATALGGQGTKPSRDWLAHLSLVSRPSGKITVDDSIVGETPKALSVPAGTHRIRISREGYIPYEITMAILGGEYLRITDIVLKKQPRPVR
ncbi:MAG TPA: PEGA domain-containing protein [Gemmatimonadales bacterium]|nr:PEGA domain-containing protein [Gemmatimonadales bacterium]